MKAMKPTLTLISVCFAQFIFSQCSFNADFSGSTCESAKFICGIELNGYQDVLADTLNTETQISYCSQSPLFNEQWISFAVCDEYVEIKITPSNCTEVEDNGAFFSGIQAGIYSECHSNANLVCTNQDQTESFTLSGNNFTPNTLVYMFIGGSYGSVCDFEIEVIAGIDTLLTPYESDSLAVPEDGMIKGPTEFCHSGIGVYNLCLPTCVGSGFTNGCGFDNPYDQGLVCYEWQIEPDTGYVFIGDSTGLEVTIEWLPLDSLTSDTFTINVVINQHPALDAQDLACGNGTGVCGIIPPLQVIINPPIYTALPDIYICEGEGYDFCGTTYYETTNAICQIDSCEYETQQIFILETVYIDLGTEFICSGMECFHFQNQEYCTPGSYMVQDPTQDCIVFYEFDIEDLDDVQLQVFSSNDIDCIDQYAVLDVDFTTLGFNGSMIVRWEDESGNPIGNDASTTVSYGGNFTCTIDFPEYGCSKSASIFVAEDVTPPEVIIEESFLNCYNPSATIYYSSNNIINFHYWEGPNGFSSFDQNPVISVGGQYQVTFIGENGCEITEPFFVNEDFDSPEVLINGPNYWTCLSEEEEINVMVENITNYEITWTTYLGSFVQIEPKIINVSSPGLYTAEVLNLDNGCITIVEYDLLNDLDLFTDFTFSSENVKCFGDENGSITIHETLGGYAPFTLALNGIIISETDLFDLSPGMYQVSITDSLGCSIIREIEITEPLELDFTLDEEIELIFEKDENISIDVSSSIEWVSIIWENQYGEQIGQGISIQTHFLHDDLLSVTLTDINGCSISKTIEINLKLAKEYYIPNIFSPNGDGANDFFTVYSHRSPGMIQEISIFDRWGDLLFHKDGLALNSDQNGWDGMFNGRPLPAAVYVYAIKVDRGDGIISNEYGSVTLVR